MLLLFACGWISRGVGAPRRVSEQMLWNALERRRRALAALWARARVIAFPVPCIGRIRNSRQVTVCDFIAGFFEIFGFFFVFFEETFYFFIF